MTTASSHRHRAARSRRACRRGRCVVAGLLVLEVLARPAVGRLLAATGAHARDVLAERRARRWSPLPRRAALATARCSAASSWSRVAANHARRPPARRLARARARQRRRSRPSSIWVLAARRPRRARGCRSSRLLPARRGGARRLGRRRRSSPAPRVALLRATATLLDDLARAVFASHGAAILLIAARWRCSCPDRRKHAASLLETVLQWALARSPSRGWSSVPTRSCRSRSCRSRCWSGVQPG